MNWKRNVNNIGVIMKQCLEGLSELHNIKIAHRDLKPGNIMINKDCRPIIIDFGFSEEINKSKFLFQACGSPGFIAPEIIDSQSRNNIDYLKADIFSLGVIFYSLYTTK